METTMAFQFNEEVGMSRMLDITAPAGLICQPQAPTLDATTSNPYGDTLAAIAAMLRFHMVALIWGMAVVMINLAALIWFTGVVIVQSLTYTFRWIVENLRAAPVTMDYTADTWTTR
jgi:hypothetical protein